MGLGTSFWKRPSGSRGALCVSSRAARRQPLPGVPGTLFGSDKGANSFHFGKDYLRLAPQKFKQGLTALWDGQLGGQNGHREGGGARAMGPEESSEGFRGPGPVTGQSRSKPSCSAGFGLGPRQPQLGLWAP